MNDIRAKFEEIWPVPDGVIWDGGEYMPEDDLHMADQKYFELAAEHDARLDTFTRCQETTGVYVSIVDEMVKNMGLINERSTDLFAIGVARESIGRAKQKMGIIK